MELAYIAVALFAGLAVRRLGLPPLVGFLLAGFGLRAAGHASTPDLERYAAAGVTLLLFSIGLKLEPRELGTPAIWAGGGLCMLVSTLAGAALVLGLASAGVVQLGPDALEVALLLGFALSFSSTVVAVKLLDERGESRALHGRVAVGVLIVQDLAAVAYLAIAADKTPTPWALLLLPALVLARPFLRRLLDGSGHGELLVLHGVVLCAAGWFGFEQVGLKGDLGALVLGAMLAGTTKTDELARALLGLKDLLLVCFFLGIGLSSPLNPEGLGIAALLMALVPVKAALFLGAFLLFRLRARTSLFAASTLANASEFGLLVGSMAVARGLLDPAWLAVLAVTVSLTFVCSAWIRRLTDAIHLHHHERLIGWQRSQRLPGDEPLDPGGAQVIVLGMGRAGTDLYDALTEALGPVVVGVDQDATRVERRRAEGRRVLLGDASDIDFWDRVVDRHTARAILLTMSSQDVKLRTARAFQELSDELPAHQRAWLGAIARFDDEQDALERAGVRLVHDAVCEAGHGFGESVARALAAPGEEGAALPARV